MERKIKMCHCGRYVCVGAIIAGGICGLVAIVGGLSKLSGWVHVLLSSLLVMACSVIAHRYCQYWDDIVSHFSTFCTYMRFEDWYRIYGVDPKKWKLDNLPYKNDGKMWSSDQRIVFPYVDYLRYRCFRKKVLEVEESEQNRANLIKILEEAQADIDKLKAKSSKEIDDGNRLILDVIGRMK